MYNKYGEILFQQILGQFRKGSAHDRSVDKDLHSSLHKQGSEMNLCDPNTLSLVIESIRLIAKFL